MVLLILEFCASENSCLVYRFLYVHMFTHDSLHCAFIHKEVGLCLSVAQDQTELSITSCMTLGKLLNFSVPLFPPL